MTESHVRTLLIRQPPVPQEPVKKTRKGEEVLVQRHPVRPPGAVTISYRFVEPANDPAPRIAMIGVAFCSERDSFERKRGRHIAEHRLFKNPLRIAVADREMTKGLIVAAVRTLALDPPQWEEAEELEVVNPSRFNARLRANVLGPDGGLIELSVDARDNEKKRPRHHARFREPLLHERMSTWALRVPRWAGAFLSEATL